MVSFSPLKGLPGGVLACLIPRMALPGGVLACFIPRMAFPGRLEGGISHPGMPPTLSPEYIRALYTRLPVHCRPDPLTVTFFKRVMCTSVRDINGNSLRAGRKGPLSSQEITLFPGETGL